MNPSRPTVVVTLDGSRTLLNAQGEGYKSLRGALTEARAVYLVGSGVASRLASHQASRVLEVGFGTGLNFLVTAAAAQAAGTHLCYIALELAPPPAEALRELLYPELLAPSPLPDALVAWRAGLGEEVASGWHTFEHGQVHLELFVGNALSPAWETRLGWQADAVYHDAFGPSSLPELWSREFLGRVIGRLAPGGSLVSFSVAGEVRRALESHGLRVGKVAGPEGGKREVLVARKPAATP